MKKTTNKTNSVYTWQSLKGFVFQHKKALIFANVVAIVATLLIIPIPLLMPMLVDEVLLDNPGALLHAVNDFLPQS